MVNQLNSDIEKLKKGLQNINTPSKEAPKQQATLEDQIRLEIEGRKKQMAKQTKIKKQYGVTNQDGSLQVIMDNPGRYVKTQQTVTQQQLMTHSIHPDEMHHNEMVSKGYKLVQKDVSPTNYPDSSFVITYIWRDERSQEPEPYYGSEVKEELPLQDLPAN